jgi:hypothetical protein
MRAQSPQFDVRGRVVDQHSGEPVPFVDVLFKQGKQEATATSDSRGDFQIQLAAGSYLLRAVGDGVIATRTSSISLQKPASLVVQVARLAKLQGTVVYDSGAPATGAEVRIRKDQKTVAAYLKTGELFPAQADDSGAFELLLPPGSFRLRASDGKTDGFATVEKLKPGETRKGMRIVIDRSVAISGKVLLPNGKPAIAAEVFISTRIPGTQQYDRFSIRSNSHGRFSQKLLRPGDLVVEATLWGYAPSPPHPVTLRHAQKKDAIALRLTQPASIEGIVVDEMGKPLEEVEVARVWQGSKQRYEKIFTEADGLFAFRNVGPGPHMVRVRKPGFLEFADHRVMAPRLDLRFVMATAASVRGRVSSRDGPVSQFTIYSKQARQSESVEFLDKDGEYQVTNLHKGKLELRVEAPGHKDRTVKDIELSAGQSSVVNIELEKR